MVPKAGYIIEDDIKIIREEPFMSARSFMITCGKQASLPNVAREVDYVVSGHSCEKCY